MKLTFNLKEIKGQTQAGKRSGRPTARMKIGREGVLKLTNLIGMGGGVWSRGRGHQLNTFEQTDSQTLLNTLPPRTTYSGGKNVRALKHSCNYKLTFHRLWFSRALRRTNVSPWQRLSCQQEWRNKYQTGSTSWYLRQQHYMQCRDWYPDHTICEGTVESITNYFYRPQRSWAKVIFSEVCVKNSVHRGGLQIFGGGISKIFFSFSFSISFPKKIPSGMHQLHCGQ